MKLLDWIPFADWEKIAETKPGMPLAVTGATQSLAAALAARGAEMGRRVLLVAEHDLKAGRMAEDVRQLTGKDCAFLPGGEIDLTRAAGSQESSWRRLEALCALGGADQVLVTSAEALMQRMGRPEPFRQACFTLRPGDRMPLSELSLRLTRMGYERVSMVEGKGQFALRGAICDLYPPAGKEGIRIEFFDDEVDSLRTFDCISQRSQDRLERIRVTPASEALLPPEEAERGAERMRAALKRRRDISEEKPEKGLLSDLPPLPEDAEDEAAFFDRKIAPRVREQAWKERESNEMDRRLTRLLADANSVESGLPFRRMRGWMPVLTDHCASLLDWFRPDMILLWEPDRIRKRTEERLTGFGEDLASAVARGEAVPEQEGLLRAWEDSLGEMQAAALLAVTEMPLGMGGIRPADTLNLEANGVAGYHGQVRTLRGDLASWREKGYRVLMLCGGEARGRRLAESLAELNEKAVFATEITEEPDQKENNPLIVPGTLSGGFVLPSQGRVLVSDADIWGEGYRKSRSKKRTGERISTFTELKVGDYVVHEDHGVGIYRGITRVQSESTWRDYLLIQYLGSDKLYVPVEQLERVQRYIGNPGSPPKLNSLGGGEWAKQKGKVKEGLKSLAFDLKKLYAERSQRTGFAFSPGGPWQREFEDEFPWELTADQKESVREIEEDMESDRNMDRLLCGDVGYGKTEVSLRAAFKAVADGKQVAMLAPTTILVQQHYNTVLKRFHNTGARVDFLSRFRTPKESRQVLADLAEGKIDILIGTHRLLAKDVKFKDLGLLIVDEEQRFGVAHKEAIKNLKRQVDVLTLSATPIPRTLHMSMTGIRDMSVLETPPEERIPVQTQVIEYSDAVIRDAVLREISRGGQVYFLYNRVQSIEQFYTRLRALVPEARIGVAHGQMKERALEDVMMDFYAGSYDVLLCTTIIESGLDVPSANTLIVFDAERFGLSQLYQLRGRVGRSNRQAYAYFTVRTDKILSETAQQRLEAIREFTEFGAGFRIAMRDLEIRGAGNILGPEQHGHLATVGYDMYCKLMEETLLEVGQGTPRRELETRVDLRVDAFLPSDYVADEKQRMEMYKRIAAIQTEQDRGEVLDEMIDRYGDMPAVVETLLDVSMLRAMCNQLGICQVTRTANGASLRLDERYIPDPALLMQAMVETSAGLNFSGGSRPALVYRTNARNDRELLDALLKVIRKLKETVETLQAKAEAKEKTGA
ncbi:MAG: transcription-repair coupling factor [Clostridia bacterium]|nr:transcription-repair coupling factor [Clostridia bacterium]